MCLHYTSHYSQQSCFGICLHGIGGQLSGKFHSSVCTPHAHNQRTLSLVSMSCEFICANSSKSCVKVALRKNSSPMQQDTNNKTVQPTFRDVVTNHSYALLHQSPQCTGQQQHKSSSAGDTEPGAWQYTTPARSEDELISQLKELTVREISLDHIE